MDDKRFQNFLLALITPALWLIALNPWIAPKPAEAQITNSDAVVEARVVWVHPQVIQDLARAGGVPVRPLP